MQWHRKTCHVTKLAAWLGHLSKISMGASWMGLFWPAHQTRLCYSKGKMVIDKNIYVRLLQKVVLRELCAYVSSAGYGLDNKV